MSGKIDKSDLKCVWMAAGVVNYKLCDKNFHCETCRFYNVMHGMIPDDITALYPEEEKEDIKNIRDKKSIFIDRFIYHFLKDYKICIDRNYHSLVLWSKWDKNPVIMFGLDQLALKLFEPIDKIRLPEKNLKYSKGMELLTIERKGKQIQVLSDFDGEVMQINPLLKKEKIQSLIKNDLYLFKFRIRYPGNNSNRLFINLNSLESTMKKVEVLSTGIRNTLSKKLENKAGKTMPDGGNIEQNLEILLGKDGYFRLIEKLFGQKI